MPTSSVSTSASLIIESVLTNRDDWRGLLDLRVDKEAVLAKASYNGEEINTTDQLDVYIRPNGESYVPRGMSIGGELVHDVVFVRKAHDAKMPILLFGDPGTGKTALFEAAFGDDLVTVQGTVETEKADLEGSWTQQSDGTFSWVDGPLVVALEAGRPLLIDEIALIDPRVLALVYGVMDGRDELVVTANPQRGVVKMAPGFMVFGACNPDVPGAVMSDALLSRFRVHIEMSTDWALPAKLGVNDKIITVARNLNSKKGEHQITAAPQLRELLTFRDVEKVFGVQIALRNFVSQTRPEDRAAVLEAIETVFATKVDVFKL